MSMPSNFAHGGQKSVRLGAGVIGVCRQTPSLMCGSIIQTLVFMIMQQTSSLNYLAIFPPPSWKTFLNKKI